MAISTVSVECETVEGITYRGKDLMQNSVLWCILGLGSENGQL